MAWTQWEQVSGEGLDFSEVIYEKKKHIELGVSVARVTFNRPKQLNAITAHTQDEMFRAFYDASQDPLVGAVILTGAGDRAFCVGGDVEWEQWGLRDQFYWRYEPNRLLRICRKPVIAAVRGFCIGSGNHMAYCCDFTIAAENAIFGQNGPRISSPADGAFVSYLVRVIGAKKAREMWMLCRRYTADEALKMGLVNAVVPLDKLDEEVDKWCEELLSASPGCIEILKAAFDWEIDAFPATGLLSNWLYPGWFDTKEGKEGGQAFMEKRKPDFWRTRRDEVETQRKAQESDMEGS